MMEQSGGLFALVLSIPVSTCHLQVIFYVDGMPVHKSTLTAGGGGRGTSVSQSPQQHSQQKSGSMLIAGKLRDDAVALSPKSGHAGEDGKRL